MSGQGHAAYLLEEAMAEAGSLFNRVDAAVGNDGERLPGYNWWPEACVRCGGSVIVRDGGTGGCEDCRTDAADLLAELTGKAPAIPVGVVVPLTSNTTTTTPLPFMGRRLPADLIRQVDMAEVLSRPEDPMRWAIEGFTQRGALTVLAARGGTGKSWVGMEACASVQAGRPFADLEVEQGPAVYVDGEMGQRQMAGRFRAGGVAPNAFTVLDVTGLDLGAEDGCAALEQRLAALGASFVVVDSLRRLTPGKKESDSDDMAPFLGRLAVMAKTLDLAMLLIHHAGWSEDRAYRGSTAIGDQADAVLALDRDGDVLRLSCNPERGCKMRGAEEPPPRWLRLAIGEQPGVVVIPASPQATTTPPSRLTAAQQMREALLDLFAGIVDPVRKGDAAGGLSVGADNQSFRAAWRQLVAEGAIVETAGGFMLAERAPHPVAEQKGAGA